MNPTWQKKINEAESRIAELQQAMESGGGDWQALSLEYGRLLPLTQAGGRWRRAGDELENVKELLDDSEVGALAAEELTQAQKKFDAAAAVLRRLLSPENKDDVKNCFMEIRAAVGGNESCLFAADLLRMYCYAAEALSLKVEAVSHSDGEVGGYKEVVIKICGAGAYGRLKFESGAHRVQRVPQTESQGRVHTSVVTVVVMPEADDDDEVQLNMAEVRVETFRASGAGGQHVNTTDSAVRMTHLPSGIIAECQDERSQHQNRERALSVLKARILNARRREQKEKEDAQRRSFVGSGERSDKIRTYNFPQGRMTDHRIGLTLYKLNAVMAGDLSDVFEALAAAQDELDSAE